MQILFIFGPNTQVKNLSLSRIQLGACVAVMVAFMFFPVLAIYYFQSPQKLDLKTVAQKKESALFMQKNISSKDESKLIILQANLESAQKQLEQIQALQLKLDSYLSLYPEKIAIPQIQKREVYPNQKNTSGISERAPFNLRLDQALADSFSMKVQLDRMKGGVSPNWEYARLSFGSPPLVPPLELSSSSGIRLDPFTQQIAIHEGTDFKAHYGASIFATADGVVVRAGWDREYGYVVDLEHPDKTITRYAHAQQLLVKLGDSIKRAQVIAKVGSTGRSTGPHLHYEVLKNTRNFAKG